ncbi:MAG: hypothetical protein ACC707_07935 [Thiohalomonadales bacterium]
MLRFKNSMRLDLEEISSFVDGHYLSSINRYARRDTYELSQ